MSDKQVVQIESLLSILGAGRDESGIFAKWLANARVDKIPNGSRSTGVSLLRTSSASEYFRFSMRSHPESPPHAFLKVSLESSGFGRSSPPSGKRPSVRHSLSNRISSEVAESSLFDSGQQISIPFHKVGNRCFDSVWGD